MMICLPFVILMCFRISLIATLLLVKVFCHTVLLREINAFDLSFNLRGEVSSCN